MGRLFSYQDIVESRFPSPEHFPQAVDYFLARINEGVEDGVFSGGFVYGSAAIGLANRRSDLDLLISLEDSRPESYRAAQSVTWGLRAKFHDLIPISAIVQTREELENARHATDRFFGIHLRGDDRKVAGRDPAGYIRFKQDTAHDILDRYFLQKARRLGDTYTEVFSHELEKGGLQRMMELPAAVGRKTVQALADVHIIPEAVCHTADKDEVRQASLQVFSEHEVLIGGFNRLVQANADYNRVLEGAINGTLYPRDYHIFLEDLHQMLPSAIAWINAVSDIMLPQIRSAELQLQEIR